MYVKNKKKKLINKTKIILEELKKFIVCTKTIKKVNFY